MSLLPKQNRFDLDTLFDHFFTPSRFEHEGFFSPKVDIKDNKEHYIIHAELPGVKKEDIHLELHNGVLTLSAEVKQEDTKEKEGKVIRQERRYGSMQRSFTVGDAVQERDISAKFEDGLLTVTAPKAQPSESSRQKINVS